MWWESKDHLKMKDGVLHVGDKNTVELASDRGTPTYIYDLTRIKNQYEKMHRALSESGLSDPQIHYAMKANNEERVLQCIKEIGGKIEANSIGEIELAREIGYEDSDIVFTGTSLSAEDLSFLAKSEVLVVFDTMSAMRNFDGEPGHPVGIRVNSGRGLGRGAEVRTGGDASKEYPVKFGLSDGKVLEAARILDEGGYKLTCLHHHVGSGWLEEQIPEYLSALENLLEIVSQLESENFCINTLDIGGGYGVPHKKEEQEFPLTDFFHEVSRKIDEHEPEFEKIIVEPGTFLVSDAGVLLCKVNYLEEKRGRMFAGVDTGLNGFNSPAHYGYYHEIVPCNHSATDNDEVVTIAGNICEAGDLFAVDRSIPTIEEGDILAILNAGAYGYVMANNYTLRPVPYEVVIDT